MIFTRKYKILLGSILFFSSAVLSAQNIELPDVTTVISGDTVKAGKDALSDFNDVLVKPDNSGKVVPVLPDVDAPGVSEVSTDSNQSGEKSIYAEGLIGGGYPSLFTGNFSVFRLSGDSPFKLSFEHNSAIGYGNHSLTEGYSDRTTVLQVEKYFQKNQFNWGFNGAYSALANGLQNHYAGVTALNQDTYEGNGSFLWNMNKGFSLGFDTEISFYNRYADVASGTFPTASVIDVSPDLLFGWRGNGFTAGFTAQYWFESDLNNTVSNEKTNRGMFDLSLNWENDVVKVGGNGGVIVGNRLNDNAVVPEFNIGVESSLPVYFSNRHLTFAVKGGLDSKMNKIGELEKNYKFSALTVQPEETSDWYGLLDFSIPVKDSFTGAVKFEYRQTAFGNGCWMPDTDNNSKNLFTYSAKDLQQFNSDLSLTYHYKIFSITGQWKSYWLDVPALTSAYQLGLDVNIQSENSKWGVDANILFNLSSENPFPVVNLDGFVRLTPAVRLVVSVEDMITLVSGNERVYAGNFITRSGTATVLLKFFF